VFNAGGFSTDLFKHSCACMIWAQNAEKLHAMDCMGSVGDFDVCMSGAISLIDSISLPAGRWLMVAAAAAGQLIDGWPP